MNFRILRSQNNLYRQYLSNRPAPPFSTITLTGIEFQWSIFDMSLQLATRNEKQGYSVSVPFSLQSLHDSGVYSKIHTLRSSYIYQFASFFQDMPPLTIL
jgi:hypothetical protein